MIAARLEPGDVGENQAAERLAEALAAPLVRRSRAATGRVNLAAETPGLLRVDAARIDRLNAVHEALTVGTLPDHTPVAARDMVATIKVIPFAVPGAVLAEVEALARRRRPRFALHPFRPLRAGLVLTELPGLKDSVAENTIAATEARVAGLTGTPAAAAALPARRSRRSPRRCARCSPRAPRSCMVAGASAVVDRRDVGPAGIVRAGGEIRHFGMPVDPGNLICIGRIGDRPALVLPGCAGSPRANGIDFVLQRLYAGLDVGPAEVMRMGVGGLLKDVAQRPLPRAKATAAPAARAAAAPDHRRRGAGRRPVQPHGAAQQAAAARPRRQADDRPRGGQRAVQRRPPRAGGRRPPRGRHPRRPWAAGRCASSRPPTTPPACPPA